MLYMCNTVEGGGRPGNATQANYDRLAEKKKAVEL